VTEVICSTVLRPGNEPGNPEHAEVTIASTTFAFGEILYEATLHFTKVTDYGFSMAALLGGQAPPPPAGSQIDVWFEGDVSGPKIKGHMSGIDYLQIRADGQVRLHIHAEIATGDGERIAFFGDGIIRPDPATGLLLLRENIALTSAFPSYAWVNTAVGWGQGTVDPATGEIRVTVYAV
jgi:hypothetical protein